MQSGQVLVGGEAVIDVPVAAEGVFLLEVNSRGDIVRVTIRNDHAATVGNRLCMASMPVRLYFMVPQDLSQFALTLQSPSPGETALLRVFDP